MFRFIIQGLLLISAATLVVDAIIAIGNGNGKRSADIESLPYGCQAEVDVEKRDGSEEVDFIVCVKAGRVCTTRDVTACSSIAQQCEGFKHPDTAKLFKKMFPKAYANVCQEPTGELCLYTDIKYKTCGKANTMNNNVICITLSNGEEECSEIPPDFMIEQKLIQLQSDKEQLPQYRPTLKVNGAKISQIP